MNCWEQDFVSIGTAGLTALSAAAITLHAGWHPELLRWAWSWPSFWALVVNALLGAGITLIAIRQGVLAPSSCQQADVSDAFRGLLGAIPAAVAAAVFARSDPEEPKGTAGNVFRPLPRLLVQGAVSDIEARRAACGGELMSALGVAECVENFPSWLQAHHKKLARHPDFGAELNRLVTLKTAGLRDSAVRAHAGGMLLCWLPVKTLRLDIATYLGQRTSPTNAT